MAEAPTGALASLRAPRETRRILVVDDDPTIRFTLADILSVEGYPIETAANGQEALDYVRRDRPALILLDMRMPVLDGWGFKQRLDTEGITVPIIVITAANNARAWAHEVNANDWLGKPFDLDELLEKIARFIPPTT